MRRRERERVRERERESESRIVFESKGEWLEFSNLFLELKINSTQLNNNIEFRWDNGKIITSIIFSFRVIASLITTMTGTKVLLMYM